MNKVEVGDVVAFRESDSIVGQSLKARVVDIQPSGKASFRYSLELEDGSIRKVPRPRIKGPWAKAAEIDELVNHQVRLHAQRGGEEQDRAASFMIESCRLGEAMELGSADDFIITDPKTLEELVDSPLDVLLDGVLTAPCEEGLQISPMGGVRIVQRFAEVSPDEVLEVVAKEEKEWKFKLREHQGINSARWEWEFYCEHYRPMFELWREWCGFAAVRKYEREIAAEAEGERLFDLAKRLIEIIEEKQPEIAKMYRQELLAEQITPYTIRETPDRPLEPDEIPVRVEYRRRRWG